MSWADLDNNGWCEVWISNYSDNKIEAFKFRHADEASFSSQFLQ